MKARTIAGLLAVGVIGIFCVGYAPTNLGGRTTYVSTYGTSMRPHFHAGDLAAVQPAHDYHVGEVVAYHSSTLHNAVVLHRIVAIDHGRFTLKGDNNDFLDPAHPTADEIVGRLGFRVAHGGTIRSFLARPLLLFPLLALAIGGAASGFLTHKRRRRPRVSGHRPNRPARVPTSDRRLRVVVPIAATVSAVGFLVAVIAVWNNPRTEVTTRRESYSQHLAVTYHAAAARGAAYPDGSVDTGDPIFTRLVKRVDVGLDYDLRADARPHRAHGTYQLMADITSVTGWSQSIPLTPVRAFTGTHIAAHAPLSLAVLSALEARFSDETGLVTTQATLTIAPTVHVRGEIADTPFSGSAMSNLEFQLSPDAMTTTTTTTGAAAAATTHTGSVTVSTTRPAAVTLWKLTMSADAARVALFVAFALALAAAAAVLAVDRCRVALGELDAIQRRYGRLLIAVDAIPEAGGRSLLRVESMRALAQLAQVNEQPIVHAGGTAGHRFALATDAVVYYYDPAPERLRPVHFAPAAAPA